ncbi:MAG: molybdopterin-dependent oxidoreductase [Acidimicrobiia bacterium]
MTERTVTLSGHVANPGKLTRQTLERLPSYVGDLESVSEGAVGAGVRIADIVSVAGPEADAAHCTVISADRSYRASVPLSQLVGGGWLATSLDGAPLPVARGGPFRLTVADGTTLCWNVKDVGEFRFTVDREPDSVPENPPH